MAAGLLALPSVFLCHVCPRPVDSMLVVLLTGILQEGVHVFPEQPSALDMAGLSATAGSVTKNCSFYIDSTW